MRYHLFLDDERNVSDVTWVSLPRNVNWVVVRNYDEFVKTITSFGLPEYVTFDHDLADEHYKHMLTDNTLHNAENKFKIWMPGGEENDGLTLEFDYGKEKTGYDCAKWLVEFCMDRELTFPPYEVHSMNPVGKQRIIGYVEGYKKHAVS